MAEATGQHKPIAQWDAAKRPLIRTSDADVLAILDCCYSSNAVKAVSDDPRVYELLAACPFNEKTWGPSPASFTTALTKVLNDLLDKHGENGFPVLQLYQHILMIRTKPVAMRWDRLGSYHRSIILAPVHISTPIEDTEIQEPPVTKKEGSPESELTRNTTMFNAQLGDNQEENENEEEEVEGPRDSAREKYVPVISHIENDLESERQKGFQDQVDSVLGKANGYFHVAVLIIRWHEHIDDFPGHSEEVSIP